MKQFFVKISFIIVVQLIFLNCNAVKKVSEGKFLLVENEIYVNGELVKEKKLYNYLVQRPNQKLLGNPLRLHFYNLARENADSVAVYKLESNPKKKKVLKKLLSKKQVNRYVSRKYSFNEWVKKTGQAPVIVDPIKVKKSQKRLEAYFWNRGWFNVKAGYKIIPVDSLRAKVSYHIKSKKPFVINDFKVDIVSKVADSIYNKYKDKSVIELGEQYETNKLEQERDRITKLFRNKGLFHFERDLVKFKADTLSGEKKVDLILDIKNRSKVNRDSTSSVPFKVHKISKVKIYTDANFKNSITKPQDSTVYKGYELYAYKKLKFEPKAITNAVFTAPNTIYSDSLRALTYNSLNNLSVFKYPTINFITDPEDPDKENLIASIFLSPRKKYALGLDLDVSTSVIQDIGLGFGGSLLIRNFFRRAETFEISVRNTIGASQDLADNEDQFFNISELGLDAKLNFPRILFLLNTDKIIKKSSAPKTSINVGVSTQKNIGLDKINISGNFQYSWKPNNTLSNQFNLFSLQFINNTNSENYYNVYQNSYNRLNAIAKQILPVGSPFLDGFNNLIIPNGADTFSNRVLGNSFLGVTDGQRNEIRNLAERKDRLTENNLILSTSYSLINDTRSNLYDEDFSRFRFKLESAGFFLNWVAQLTGVEDEENLGVLRLRDVAFSQFFKIESEYIKHWDLGQKNIVAVRAFGGVAIPYGNSDSVPFSQSYFGGGSNDNRAWSPYDLGPGSSFNRNEFNEANFKLSFNAEYRFNILGSLNGALFVDAGNIWNVLDSFDDDDEVTFSGIKDLSEIALGTGLGLRYDFDFFVLRLDTAFKAYNPSLEQNKRWREGFSLKKAVFNVGINYPF